jgi:hypothetical protein
MLKLRMLDVYLHYPICVYGIVLNYALDNFTFLNIGFLHLVIIYQVSLAPM